MVAIERMTWDMDIKVPLEPLDALVKPEMPLPSTSTPAFNVLLGHWVNMDPDADGADRKSTRLNSSH